MPLPLSNVSPSSIKVRRFQSISSLQLVARGEQSVQVVRQLPDGVFAVDQTLKVMSWINRAHLDDLQNSGGYTSLEIGADLDSLDASTGFQQRSAWRLGSLVVFFLNVAGICRRVFSETDAARRLAAPDSTGGAIEPDTIEGYAAVKLWRDKVFAHTAFAEPRIVKNKPDRGQSERPANVARTGLGLRGVGPPAGSRRQRRQI